MANGFSWQRWVSWALYQSQERLSSSQSRRRHRRCRPETQTLEDRTLLAAQTLDLNFGTGGSVITNLQAAGRTEVIHDVAIQVDEKIVVAGSSWNGTSNDFLVGRYLPGGAIDNTFGTGGFVKLDFFGRDDEAWGVALQANGSIIVAGSAGRATGNIIAYARLTPSGVLDTSFGTTSFGMPGKMTSDFGSTSVAYDVAVQPDDKIVLVGDIFDGHRHDSAILRYDTNGLDDYTFASGIYTYFGGGLESGLRPRMASHYSPTARSWRQVELSGRAVVMISQSPATYRMEVSIPRSTLMVEFSSTWVPRMISATTWLSILRIESSSRGPSAAARHRSALLVYPPAAVSTKASQGVAS